MNKITIQLKFKNKQIFFTLQKKSSSNPLSQKGASLSKVSILSKFSVWCIGFSSFDSICVCSKRDKKHYHNSLAASYYFCVARDFCQNWQNRLNRNVSKDFSSFQFELLYSIAHSTNCPFIWTKSSSSSCLQHNTKYIKCIYV